MQLHAGDARYRVGVPRAGGYRELINPDAREYGGSGVGNLGSVHTELVPWHGPPASVVLDPPPLGMIYLKPQAYR